MIRQLPPHDILISKELQRVNRDSDEMSGSKKGGEDKMYRQIKNVCLDLQLKNIIINENNNPLMTVIENNVKFVLKTIKDTNDTYRTLINREYIDLVKTTSTIKKKGGDDSENSDESLELTMMESMKCIEEWTMGINGEMFRANLRMLALQKKCIADMNLFCNEIHRTFRIIEESINSYYMDEIKSVDRLCKYLQLAIEMGKKIPEKLLLQDDAFIIDLNLLHFPKEDYEISETIKEIPVDANFGISQLARLRNTFKILGPTGIALQQAFIYALQDFVYFGRESCDGTTFPASWKRVDPDQIPKLVLSMFGESAYIDWRDFLIYCLNIPFPTIDELLEIRKKFRCQDLESKELITREEFMNIEFWFENNIEPNNKLLRLRNILKKHFLFELFEVSENVMNYSAFLLAFCKNVDPKEGFSKALTMAIGEKVCYLIEDCEVVIQKNIEAKKKRDERRARAYEFTNTIIDIIMNNVITTCEGTTISEVEYDPSAPEKDKKGKKSKKDAKTKTLNDNSSNAKSTKPLKKVASSAKTTVSGSDSKTVFVCKTCQEQPEMIGTEKEKKEEIIEEEKEQPSEDKNLIYSVDQSVIWNVLQICLPWHFMLAPDDSTPYKTQIKELFTRLEGDTDDKSIYVSKFLADSNVCKILYNTKRFQELNFYRQLLKVSIK